VRERAREIGRGIGVAPEQQRGNPVDRGDELAQLARRREVLVFVGDVHGLDAVDGIEPCDHGAHEIVGCARTGRDADHRGVAQEPGVELSDRNPGDVKKAFDLYYDFDYDLGVQDMVDTWKYLEKRPEVNGKVAKRIRDRALRSTNTPEPSLT